VFKEKGIFKPFPGYGFTATILFYTCEVHILTGMYRTEVFFSLTVDFGLPIKSMLFFCK